MCRTSFLVLAVALLLPATGSAQQSAPPSNSAVIGTVRDSAGLLLAEVTVTIAGLRRSTVTDRDGQFRVGGLPAGQHTLYVRRIGFVFLEHTVTLGERETRRMEMVLVPRPALLEQMVVRVPGTGVRGVVHDYALEPIARATVSLDVTSRSFRTGEDGWFHATGLPPGRYLVQVRAPGFETRRFSLLIEAGEARELSVPLVRGRGDARDEIEWMDFAQRRRWRSRALSLFMVREELMRRAVLRVGDIPEVMQLAGPNPCVRAEGLYTYVSLAEFYVEELEAIEVLPPEALPWTNDGVSRRQRRMMDRGIGRGISRTDSSRCTSNVTIWVRDG